MFKMLLLKSYNFAICEITMQAFSNRDLRTNTGTLRDVQNLT